ncbi:myb-like protein P [Rhagoletis pomonella]|uniref:myb-like protein P n=1 Tax=Rhagoletis pomonella TaxID=28610 RepID=UPI001786107A|nr:myb-like protein P [Rhagoletis pomonella]XP_036338401.1 myb-like protein P [Rhagoletis pomonella]XP_036338402.1 myb-like protein P [Rhagoletis pomonella]XP_036338403.1 myb-like protein P [Rhagoletis pomonella]
MESSKMEEPTIGVQQPQQLLQIGNANLGKNKNENINEIENEHGIEGKRQSTDTSENSGDEKWNTTTRSIDAIMPPITARVDGGEPNGKAPKVAAETVANSNEETEKVAMVDADATMMSTATPPDTNPNTNTKTKTNTTTTTTTTITKTLVAATATTADELKATKSTSKLNEFIVPAIPKAKAIGTTNGAGGGEPGTSAKKKRNKSSKKRKENEARNNNNSKKSGARVVTNGTRSQDNATTTAAAAPNPASGAANMKTSVSMTSLPPDDEKAESRDVIKAKLRIERPYNSLKKNIERNVVCSTLGVKPHCFSQSQSSTSSFANHRYSWGSGYSYSSSSLQSNATLGLGSAKDDLWAAIQTNYNYIMDTNLLDSCKEAERHLAEQIDDDVDCKQSQCCLKLLGVTQRREMLWHDPKELRKWLREMEERLETAPTLSAATALTTSELQRCLAEHSVLYHEIVSHARVVSACIRAASEKHQGQVYLQQQQEEEQQLQSFDSCGTTIAEQSNSSLTSNEEEPPATTKEATGEGEQASDELSSDSSSSGIETAEKSSLSPRKSSARSATGSPELAESSKIVEDSLDRLQNRYHLLYLKAFEVQLWLDGLLRKKSSTAVSCIYL